MMTRLLDPRSPQCAMWTETSGKSVLTGDVKVEVAFGVTPRVKETFPGQTEQGAPRVPEP